MIHKEQWILFMDGEYDVSGLSDNRMGCVESVAEINGNQDTEFMHAGP